MTFSWTAEQERVITSLAEWIEDPDGEQVKYLAGFAGSGKTLVVSSIGVEAGAVFTALTGKACDVMAKRGCPNPQTLHSLLYRPTEVSDEHGKRSIEFLPRPDSPLHDAPLVIADEASMISGDLAADLMSYGCKILAVGDPFQLPPVGNGKGFFSSRKPDFMLTEVKRHDNGILRLATDIRTTGKYSRVRGHYGDEVSVSTWRALDGDGLAEVVKGSDQVLVGTNARRHALNAFCRGVHGYAGLPGVGEKVLCRRNDTRRGLINGALYLVSAVVDSGVGWIHMRIVPEGGGYELDVVSHDHLFLGVKGERLFDDMSWHEQKKRAMFTYGWALTVHAAQGSGWSRVCVVDESAKFRKDAAKHAYTSVTRAEKELVLVTTT